jgi:uncharacterized protein
VIAFDTNILFPLVVSDHPRHGAVSQFVRSVGDDVALSEFALVELYGLLRQPAVMAKALDARHAAQVCTELRNHPKWRLIGFPADTAGVHRGLWQRAAEPGFGRRRIYDARMGLSLVSSGVRDFATVNVKDFAGLGFRRVFNPLAD